MPISQQRIISLEVRQLKILRDVTISFVDHPLTSILGPNGCGKSTVLHALACAFQPASDQGEGYKFSSFFLPSTDALWEGSEMTLTHSYRDGQATHDSVARTYSKFSDRWAPRYSNRPTRDLTYIGIDKCVPMIESENRQVRINYETTQITEEIVLLILQKASFVLDRNYTSFNRHNAQGREFIGVGVHGIRYSALSMSAGEQKVFYILEKLFRAPKYALILIDELDLLLHEKALKRLVQVMNERAAAKSIQVVFTTHRESLVDFEGEVNIRHLLTTPDRTYCLEETKPDAIARLTGSQPRPIEIFVEDDLAAALVRAVSGRMRATKWVSVSRFGAAVNSFTIAGGLLIRGEDCHNVAFVLDGDVYEDQAQIDAQVNRVITGHGADIDEMRQAAKDLMFSFALPDGQHPERYIHALLCQIPAGTNEEHNEIIEAAREVVVVQDDHHYLGGILIKLGLDKQIGLSRIVDVFSTCQEWDGYVQPLVEWLQPKVEALREPG